VVTISAVTLLRELDDAIATSLVGGAGAVAAISRGVVAVIADFARFDDGVPADRNNARGVDACSGSAVCGAGLAICDALACRELGTRPTPSPRDAKV
jgi:hypothetical protein